jgi:hypothetical protein
MCCISAAEDAYCPLLIAPNRGAEKIFEAGIRRDIDVMMEIRESACATAEIFRRYIETVFVPSIDVNKKVPGCRNKMHFSFVITAPATIRKTFSLNSPMTVSLL